MFLLNMDRLRKARFLEERLPVALGGLIASPYFASSSHSQWPPEQFVFNAALGWYPESFLMVPKAWVVDCNSDSGPWGHSNPKQWAADKDKA